MALQARLGLQACTLVLRRLDGNPIYTASKCFKLFCFAYMENVKGLSITLKSELEIKNTSMALRFHFAFKRLQGACCAIESYLHICSQTFMPRVLNIFSLLQSLAYHSHKAHCGNRPKKCPNNMPTEKKQGRQGHY